MGGARTVSKNRSSIASHRRAALSGARNAGASLFASVCLLTALGCPPPEMPSDAGGAPVDSGPPPDDAGAITHDGGTGDGGTGDAGSFDAGPRSFDGGTSFDGGGPVDAGLPTDALLPQPGEVSVVQLSLPALDFGFSPPLGEAAVIVGPDGTLALLDVGNVMHADDVRDYIRWLNEDVLTPERGYPPRAPLQVEWIVLTHFHSDHIGAFERLVVDSPPLVGTLGVVHRGFVGLGPSITENDYEEVCNALRGALSDVDIPLCVPEVPPPCDADAFASTYPAANCDALPFEFSVGEGATIRISAASGHVSDGAENTLLTFGVDDNNQENARSLAGTLSFNAFRYHFGGDLTGSGAPTEPDVESLLVEIAGPSEYGALGVDVAHAHHHARRTSNNATLVDALTPADGRARNVVAGINPAHLGSPHSEVLSTWADDNRLSGGRFWTTHVTIGGAEHPLLEDADGNVIVQTFDGGRRYWMQAVPNEGAPRTRGFVSVRATD